MRRRDLAAAACVSLQETGGNPQQGNDINIQASGLGGGGGFRQASRNYFAWFLNRDSYTRSPLRSPAS